MASKTSAQTSHGTLLAGLVDSVIFTMASGVVRVFNKGSDPIYVRLDGTDPVVGGDDSYVVPANTSQDFGPKSTTSIEVRLVSVAAAPYSIEINS